MELGKESYYLRNLLDSQEWFEVAGGLVETAKELEPKIYEFWEAAKVSNGKDLRPIPSNRVIGAYFMLMAFAIENLLKGIIIKSNYTELAREAKEKNKIPSDINSHDLRNLAIKANISINADEEEMLLRLKDNLIWRGRYPVPLAEKGLDSKPLNNGDFASQAHYSLRDIDAINLLINKLRENA